MSFRMLGCLFVSVSVPLGCASSSGQFYSSRMQALARRAEVDEQTARDAVADMKRRNNAVESRVIAGRASAAEAEIQADRCEARGAAILGKQKK